MNFRNPYVHSMTTALLTGVLSAFIILAIGKWVSSTFLLDSDRVPLYDASQPIIASPGADDMGINVDEENIIPLSASSAIAVEKKPTPISAASYLVVALSASTSMPASVILEKDSLRAAPIASLTKLATAAVAENLLDQNVLVTIDRQMLDVYSDDPGDLRDGEQISAGSLLFPLLMVSSNTAAEALAESYGPGRAWFIKAMNDWAYSIGAYNTFFADPSGLSPENVSSPHDLAIMLAWIAAHRPELLAITETKVKYLGSHTWTSPTQLLNLTSYLGGKNGYLPEAGQTSVSLFNLANAASSPRLYIIVTLDSQYRDQDVLNLLAKI